MIDVDFIEEFVDGICFYFHLFFLPAKYLSYFGINETCFGIINANISTISNTFTYNFCNDSIWVTRKSNIILGLITKTKLENNIFDILFRRNVFHTFLFGVLGILKVLNNNIKMVTT